MQHEQQTRQRVLDDTPKGRPDPFDEAGGGRRRRAEKVRRGAEGGERRLGEQHPPRVAVDEVAEFVTEQGDAFLRCEGSPVRQSETQHPTADADRCRVRVEVGVDGNHVGSRRPYRLRHLVNQGEKLGCAISTEDVGVGVEPPEAGP